MEREPAPPLTGTALTARNLVKRFGDLTAVDDVSFQIRPGETYGLLGPNGAGKTTIISMVAGLFPPDSGSVDVTDIRMGPSSLGAKRHIGLVPQELAIYPDLTAEENLNFFGRLQGLRRKDLKSRVALVLDLLGLGERAREQTKKYSGGMKRRLNIGVGLLHRPLLLILDEPTVGVDPQSRNSILEAVAQLSTEGTAVLYTTHYMEEAERLCDRIAILDQGKVQAEGTRDELITLTGGVDRINLIGTGRMVAAAESLRTVPGVQQVSGGGLSGLTLTVTDGPALLASIITNAATAGMAVTSVELTRPDLESVFLHLTGKALRD
ncbi:MULTISPECIES: ABC transporter ATP-binding protein [Micrococcaceae]|uniref:ABC transporter ATP-binding protein n=1 Tax=Paenarthrobacter aromaticivorans TaxID=2849150 RepID=A0ABS6I352_9MICC|nr:MULTISPECIES: ABC transporter ATP-binding protein [Micrococcaceae]MBU8865772.1 ABC transporter ATP-binding protein [Paenarthrobacter sp. MMS21-TAE1-1]BCW06102.1 putative ABC transporter ATP-binding protein YfiL [Arthrobacter sp. NtRootA1]